MESHPGANDQEAVIEVGQGLQPFIPRSGYLETTACMLSEIINYIHSMKIICFIYPMLLTSMFSWMH